MLTESLCGHRGFFTAAVVAGLWVGMGCAVANMDRQYHLILVRVDCCLVIRVGGLFRFAL